MIRVIKWFHDFLEYNNPCIHPAEPVPSFSGIRIQKKKPPNHKKTPIRDIRVILLIRDSDKKHNCLNYDSYD